MPMLFDCLLTRTALELRTIAARLGVRTRTTLTKHDLAAVITTFWLQDPRRMALLRSLSPQARQALQRLLTFDTIPRTLFLAEFGAIRSARSQGKNHALPWRRPQSASEELAYSGLLHGSSRQPLPQTDGYLLPSDLKLLVQTWLAQPPADPPALPNPPPVQPFDVLHDVAILLAWLHRCRQSEIPLPFDRWLPADALRSLNRALLHPEPEPLPRSHRQTQRLRCLLFWATAAGLQQAGALSPLGRQWLDLPPGEQLTILWQGWRTASCELRTAFLWPDAPLPAPWPEPLWSALRTQAGGWRAEQLAAGLLATSPPPTAYWVANLDATHTLQQIVEALCTGPLAHFGLVTWTPSTEQTAAVYQLTAAGRALLQDRTPTPTDAPDAPAAAAGWRQEEDALVVEQPAACITRGLPILSAGAQRIATQRIAGMITHSYYLTAASLRRYAQHGLTLPLLLDALQSLGIVLPAPQAALLQSWCAVPAALDVSLVTLLRAPDSQTMAALHGDGAVAVHIQQLLSPAAAILDMTPAAARTLLRKRGFALPIPSRPQDDQAAGPQTEAAAAWLAGQLYHELRNLLPLPLDPPYATMEDAFTQLAPGQQAALKAVRDQMVEDLRHLLDGRAFTPPPQPSDPARWRPLLETAMAAEQWLEMLYFSPARNLVTRRHIQPAWFTQQPGPEYVLAYCQEAGALLTFRLDRIQSLQPLDQPLDQTISNDL